MMVKLFATLPLLLVSVVGHAAVVGVAELQDGASILLQDEQGPCVGSARMASFWTEHSPICSALAGL